MDPHRVGQTKACTVEHRRPEQAVEVEDVLADDVVELGVVVASPELVEVEPAFLAQLLEAGHVADRSVEPDVEELAGMTGNLEAEVGCVARDVPVAKPLLEPLLELVHHFGLQAVGTDPFAQHLFEVGELQEEVLGVALHGANPRDHRYRVDQVGGGVGGSAVVTAVAVLVPGAALRAGPLDEAIGEEHLPVRIVELAHAALGDVATLVVTLEEELGEDAVLVRMGGVEEVQADAEGLIVGLVLALHGRDQLFGGEALTLGAEHDRRAVGIVGADVVALVAAHLLQPDPDVRLDGLHHVAEVNRAVGVGQRTGDENAAFRHGGKGDPSPAARGDSAGRDVASCGGGIMSRAVGLAKRLIDTSAIGTEDSGVMVCPFRRARPSLAILFTAGLLAVLCAGCVPGAPPVAETAAPAPVGRAEYERLLASEAGAPLTVESVISAADIAFAAIEARMDGLAAELAHDGEPGDDWRPVFSHLLVEHPRDVEALLGDYRSQVERSEEFVAERGLLSVPPDSVEVVEAQNLALRQSFPLALYLNGKLAVTTSANRDPDPAYLANHCSACIPPLAVHEGYPGHHVSFWHLEKLHEYPSDEVRQKAEAHQRNLFFLEGWGLYAELLMIEEGFYAGDPEGELAAWRSLLHRVHRAKIDALLHTGQLSEEEAIESYVAQLMLTRDAAATEVRRHISLPTSKASYFIGLLQILELRDRVRQERLAAGELFDPTAFHDRLLRFPLPFPEIARVSFGIELETGGQSRLAVERLLGPVAAGG